MKVYQRLAQAFKAEGTEAVFSGTALNGAGVTWQRSPCLGKCDRGSAAHIAILVMPEP